jgi:hypothetical protein
MAPQKRNSRNGAVRAQIILKCAARQPRRRSSKSLRTSPHLCPRDICAAKPTPPPFTRHPPPISRAPPVFSHTRRQFSPAGRRFPRSRRRFLAPAGTYPDPPPISQHPPSNSRTRRFSPGTRRLFPRPADSILKARHPLASYPPTLPSPAATIPAADPLHLDRSHLVRPIRRPCLETF